MHILAIGSHPDDIEYGCGGTLIKYARQGHGVHLFVATCGSFGGDPEVRHREQLRSAEILGVTEVFWGEYTDTQIPLSQELIARLEQVIRQVKPHFIFVHSPEDTHQDHRTLSSCTISATRYIPNVLFYEGPTTQHFLPTVYVDIDATLEDKIELLLAHRSQVAKLYNKDIQDLTIIESARSCANFRGVQSRVRYAEGFAPLRLFINIGGE
ncbi:MAG: PIG-L family deacetylase [Candidatus Latescibacteria bacterium]|nr:PIG-L family deacetylase [Candidatus Latescibacterota bacterium]